MSPVVPLNFHTHTHNSMTTDYSSLKYFVSDMTSWVVRHDGQNSFKHTTIFHGDNWMISKGALMVSRWKKEGYSLHDNKGTFFQLQLQQEIKITISSINGKHYFTF